MLKCTYMLQRIITYASFPDMYLYATWLFVCNTVLFELLAVQDSSFCLIYCTIILNLSLDGLTLNYTFRDIIKAVQSKLNIQIYTFGFFAEPH